MIRGLQSVYSRLVQLFHLGNSSKDAGTPRDTLHILRKISGNKHQMPVDLRMIAKEAGVSKSAIRRHLKQLKSSDLVFFDGKDVLLSYSGLYADL